MKTRLSDDSIWFDPTDQLLKLAGRRVLVLAPLGVTHDALLRVRYGKGRGCTVEIVGSSVQSYLTREALETLLTQCAEGRSSGDDLILDLTL